MYGHLDTVTCLALSPAGDWLATGSKDTTVRLWDVHHVDGKCIVSRDRHRVYYGHDSTVILINYVGLNAASKYRLPNFDFWIA